MGGGELSFKLRQCDSKTYPFNHSNIMGEQIYLVYHLKKCKESQQESAL